MQELTERKSTRIEIIDVLRGFTLLGIALVHFTEQYYAGQPPKAHENFTNHIVTDPIISGLIGIFVSGKFYMIFSFLFGLSFFIQLNKSEKQSSFLVRFTWRLVILLVIGFVHNLFYRGDILTIYAVLGIGLLICFKLPDKILLIIALLLVINLPSIGTRAVQAISPQPGGVAFLNADQKPLEAYYETVKTGSFMDIVRANLQEFDDKMDFQIESGRLYITMGLFLLGLYAGRNRIFENTEFFKRLIKYSLWILLAAIVFAAAFFGGMQLAGKEVSQPIGWLVGGGVYDIFNACLSAIYVSLIIRLFQKEKWKKRLMVFYSVGRMGLTTYLTQTLVGVILFFGYGFGLLGEIGNTVCAAIGIAVFILQIVFSNYWLKNFQYGPVEWMWRSLTYLKIQPLRRGV
jgi:uncharacterized protein